MTSNHNPSSKIRAQLKSCGFIVMCTVTVVTVLSLLGLSPVELSIQKVKDTSGDTVVQTATEPRVILRNLSRPVRANFTCVNLAVPTKPLVCLHPIDKDVFVSSFIVTNGAYEREILDIFLGLLGEAEANVGLVDIGANIGQYSLVAASLGHDVVAVEPFKPNADRLVKAAQLNGFQDKITLLQNAVSDWRGSVSLVLSPDNQGSTKIDANVKDPLANDIGKRGTGAFVDAILLDDVLPYCRFKSALLKVDIEGSEALAFHRSSQLLDNVHVPYIFMEWAYCCRFETDPRKLKLAAEMLDMFYRRGYLPYNLDVKGQPLLNRQWWRGWPFNVLWKKKAQIDQHDIALS